MSNFDAIYKNIINNKKQVKANELSKGKIYMLKEYIKADGSKRNYSETSAPLIFVLYKSSEKDIVHAVKISDVSPNKIGKFFQNFVDKETEKFKIKGDSKKVYKTVISKMPEITNDAYRTYNISGIRKIFELIISIDELLKDKKSK